VRAARGGKFGQRATAAWFVVTLLMPGAARAQDFERVAPKTLPSTGSGTMALPAAPSVRLDPSDYRPILDRLAGIRLVDKAAKIETNGAHGEGLTLDGLKLLAHDEIESRLRAFIGKPLTAANMKMIAAEIEQWYRDHDRPFVDVVYPEQDISTGVLQAVVTEFRAGRIRFEGNNWFADWILRAQIGLESGDVIRASKLNEDIAWLNRSSFHQTTAVAQQGTLAGTTDIILHTDDRFPLRVYMSYDNTGIPAEGVNRWGLGFVWGDAFLLDQTLAYQFTSSDDFWSRPSHVFVSEGRASLGAHSLSYTVPLPWHDKLVFFGLYEQDRPDVGFFLQETGVSWQTSMRYDKTLPDWGGLSQELQAGFDFKRTNNNFGFGGFDISNSLTDIAQFPIQYTGLQRDDWGQTSISELAVLSPGHFDVNNTDAAFQPSFAHFGVNYASARYAYNDITATRITRLPWDVTAVTRVQSQLSTTNLLPSEALGLGGLDSVRGYDERTASGSLGVLATQEFRSPVFGPVDWLLGSSLGDALQFDAFWDFGHVRDNRVPAGGSTGTTLMSVGVGAHYTLNRFVDFRFENGWQLREAPGETSHGSRLIFSVVIGD